MSSIYTDFDLCPPELSYDQEPCKTGFYSLHSFIYSLETLSTCTVFLLSVCTVLPFSSQTLFSSLKEYFCLKSIVTPLSYHFHLHKTSFSKLFLSCSSLFKFVSIGLWNVNNLCVVSWYAFRIHSVIRKIVHINIEKCGIRLLNLGLDIQII